MQAMQFSNGLSNPLGLWIGHLAFDTMFSVLAATVITIVFATATSTGQFHGLGLFVRAVLHFTYPREACYETNLLVGRSGAVWYNWDFVRILRFSGGSNTARCIRRSRGISGYHVCGE